MQRGLALVAGLTGGASGFEVAYMHYRGSYNQRIMWTPLLMSQAMLGAGLWAALDSSANQRALKSVLPWASGLTLADCATGFVFHLRGIARKPGGYRMLVNNVCMGPPPFAPLLFGLAAYIGWVASRPPRGETVAAFTAFAALASGTEALYSHYQNNFQYRVQYLPLIVAPALAGAAGLAATGRNRKLLPPASALAMATGGIGSFYHLRGVLRRPGGRKKLMHNIMYGPPALAPLLFSGAGFLGLVATLLQRSRRRAAPRALPPLPHPEPARRLG